jgi:lipopolysaccharide/colanic/teichoic acid biosynthesis glycosyltransferase
VVSLVFVFVLLGINLLHLMYSRALLAWSFLATVAFYAIQSAIASRQRQVRLGVVPGGRADRLGTLAGLTWVRLSSPDDSSAALKTSGLVIDTGLPLTPEWQRVVARCAVEGLPIFDARQLHELKTGRVGLDHMDALYFSGLGQDRPYLAVKQVLDVGAALLVLPLVVPVVALAALAIRLDSRGPAFFLQKRVGHRGRIFVCYKLRSMYVAAEERAPESYGAVDPRVTPVGRVVRRFRIDELPQILNILRGEMSWIGPRPESLAWAQEYERHIPFYSVREIVKPGLSGWAAVWQGNVADVRAVAKKLQYDLFYIKHLSFELDVLIAVKTIWIIITGFGAR